ncbi:MAG: 2-iminoacetate synthase ThiH [Bacteroidetes bacterium]|nr:2-iminoacetate synthase ThiH [Bacteroidota bacterium]
MNGFLTYYQQQSWESLSKAIQSKPEIDVEQALAVKGYRNFDDFLALISPAAAPYIEQMAKLSRELTRKRFGNTIQMYIPMYLSNECQNICTYCGFSLTNDIPRITLNDKQIREEIDVIKRYGYDHILLVSGEANKTVGVDYFINALKIARAHFSHISMEVQPLDQEHYEQLAMEGLNTVLVYQETYNKDRYKIYHPKGKKSNFNYRLDTPDRLGRARVHKIGLGVLLGLEDWRTDSAFCAMHLSYLRKKYWRTKFSMSFPRLRPAEGIIGPNYEMGERELLQLICAYRIFDENLELSLSTRERSKFRDNVINLGVTSISAGSKTDPGGYATEIHALEQFEIDDNRSPLEISEMIRSKGLEPVWKDWDLVMG